MLTKYLQAELKKYSIAVGLALPGLVDTNKQKELTDDPNIPIRQKVNQLKAENKLLSPKVSAAFLAWLLLETDPSEFSEQLWDIYDTRHHSFWSKGLAIPRID